LDLVRAKARQAGNTPIVFYTDDEFATICVRERHESLGDIDADFLWIPGCFVARRPENALLNSRNCPSASETAIRIWSAMFSGSDMLLSGSVRFSPERP
jgi:hypothetical protein